MGVGFLIAFAVTALGIVGVLCVVAAAEMAWPREPLMAHRYRLRIVAFGLIAIPLGALCAKAFSAVSFGPLIEPLGFGDAVIAILVADFLYYWFHRVQHAVPWLWRVHSVHHSAEKMGAGAGYHHLLEVPLKAALVNFPAFLIFGASAGTVGFLFMMVHGFYLHSTTQLNFGPFAWILCDNRVHRIHHSRDASHFDRNFGVTTLLWDRLFGTAYFPQADEWPAVGLDDQREPQTFREWLWLPAGDRSPGGPRPLSRWIGSSATSSGDI